MPKTMIRDIELHYERAGEGAITLLFVHGMCGGGWVWDDQVSRLSDDFACVSYDRRGHSRSQDDQGDQSVATHAEDLATLIDVLGLDQPIVVASSGGAVVATEFLCRYPEMVRGAVLSEPPLFSIDPTAGRDLLATLEPVLSQAMRRGGHHAAVEAFLRTVAGSLWDDMDEARRDRYRHNAPLLFETPKAPGETVTAREIAACPVPTWIVTGADSARWLGLIARRLGRMLPNAHLEELPRSGHATYVNAPEAFGDVVRACARACEASLAHDVITEAG